ncbi:MAG: LCP family protein [Lachnospiraceae bacterium]
MIEENFGVLVDGNAEVDFEGFIKAIDVIGTIDIELNQAEADYLNKGNAKWNLVAGMNQLDGEQALSYARTRYVGHSDWERTDRQRRVIMATFDKVKGANIAEFMKLADRILPMITTDMTNAEILGYVWTVGTMGINGMESYRLPVEGTYQEATLRKGMEVLVPNLEENRAYLKKYIYE